MKVSNEATGFNLKFKSKKKKNLNQMKMRNLNQHKQH